MTSQITGNRFTPPLPPAASAAPAPLERPVKTFGADAWRNFSGEVLEEPPLPPNIDEILRSPCPIFQGQSVGDNFVLFLIPRTLGRTPLSLHFLMGFNTNYDMHLATIAQEALQCSENDQPQTLTVTSCVEEKPGEKANSPCSHSIIGRSPQRSYWVLICERLVHASKCREQLKDAASFIWGCEPVGIGNNPGQYRYPTTLEAAAMHFLMADRHRHPLRTPLRTGGARRQHRVTLCAEQYDMQTRFTLGLYPGAPIRFQIDLVKEDKTERLSGMANERPTLDEAEEPQLDEAKEPQQACGDVLLCLMVEQKQ